MEEKAPSKPTMVSRLPKYGVRSEAGSASQPRGSGQPTPRHEGKNAPPRRLNGMVHIPCISLKCKKESSGHGSLPSPEDVTALAELVNEGQQPKSTTPRMIKKPSTPNTMVRKHALMAPAANPKTIPSPSKAAPRVSTVQSPALKLNGVKPGACLITGESSGSGLPRPQTSSSRSESQGSMFHSTDSLGAPCMEHMVRSQSFTHVKQLPSPTSLPMSRSFSFNKAVELAKPLADTQLRIQVPLVKPSFAFPGGRTPVSRIGGALTPASPLSQLKKPLLPGSAIAKPLALGCRLARPSHLLPSRPPHGGKGEVDITVGEQGRDAVKTSEVTPVPHSDGQKTLMLKSQLENSTSLCLGEGLEDMSLSSSSSLDKNDTSEEFLDDFDSLGDGGGTMLLSAHEGEPLQSQPVTKNNVPDNQWHGAATDTYGFLLDGTDWTGVNVTGETSLSVDEEVPRTSSLELSPSNSSGGTYMWDEEGLEPLGPATRACGSYDSDMNSTEILNNLESCDLDDDDLMLDVDLTEDVSLHSDIDGMSQFDRAEKGSRQGQWRRRQHRWTGQDRFHDDNRGGSSQPLDGYPAPGVGRVGHHVPKSGARPEGSLAGLDEVTLRHMAQDCSSVKSQLIKLRNLLQMEDGVKIHKALASELLTPEISEDPGSALQAEKLMREVQELREELRSKERTIAQLTQQLSAHAHTPRCQCQQRAPAGRGERRSHHDKATQTPWRGQSPQILQSSNPACYNELLPQERLARIAPTEDPSDGAIATRVESLAQGPAPSPPVSDTAPAVKPAAAVSPVSDADELSLLLCTHLKIDDPVVSVDGSRAATTAEKSLSPGAGTLSDEKEAEPAERPTPGGRPRVLQPPRFHKRVSIPALPLQGVVFSKSVIAEGMQLPPPSQGLPCFSSGARAPAPFRHPRTFGCSGGHCLEEAERSTPAAVFQSNHSRLPKPKIH
ncbi:serine-rich coiled-coil domain-containing protein 2 isoform X1 [Scleropages formosus]|uniref:Coiled-coil serine-rich protein 2a n=1 Tax=Scleropages formosus TaxID=113540 RepID=A0A8C9RKX6_SCLFO|nr:serine-rich coiled-coil domain-containing protein 2 isoform X1 [Scleropages formosus]XP_018605101.2 serine-rich coiled-coil domain-containing protein 2 isoform X1 [Scleropages formosus]